MNSFKKVKEYYENHINSLVLEKQFHYFSRLYLWTKDKKYAKKIEKYLPNNDQQIEKIIQQYLFTEKRVYQKNINFAQKREKVLSKYPNIRKYFAVLFLNIISESLFKRDIGHIIEKYISNDVLLENYKKLLSNFQDIVILSTYAINYIYLVKNYLKLDLNDKIILNIYKKYSVHLDHDLVKLKAYFLTHSIIGKTKFYTIRINQNKNIYSEMLLLLETIIYDNFSTISLDVKLEYIICSKLLDYENHDLNKKILSICNNSFSENGNFIIDTLDKNNIKNNFIDSEHRNVLYIMTQSKLKI